MVGSGGHCKILAVVYFISYSLPVFDFMSFFLCEHGVTEVSWSADVSSFPNPLQVRPWIIQERSSACTQSVDVLWIYTKVMILDLSIFPLQSGKQMAWSLLRFVWWCYQAFSYTWWIKWAWQGLTAYRQFMQSCLNFYFCASLMVLKSF